MDHMLGHKISLNEFKKIEIISSIFSNQQHETRNQLQEENWNKHSHMETKQHVTKQPMDQWRNQRRN